MNRDFWYDVLRSGAILGLVMSLSFIFERYILAYSHMSLMKVSTIYCIEWVVVAVVFIWLLVRFTRRRARAYNSEEGFNYATALAYILLVSMLTGIMVGASDTLFVSAMGYDLYIDGLISRIDEMVKLYENMGVPMNEMTIFEQFTTQLRYSEQPSILLNVLGKLQVYMIVGGIPGFIIAGAVTRNPRRRDAQQ